jgi:protein TonB
VPQGRPDLALRLEPAAVADRGRSHGAAVTDLVVLTDSEEFQSALKEAVSIQQRVWRVPTTDQAAELLAAGRVGVLVIDTECVPHDAPALITHLNLEFPDLVVVVAGTHDEVSQFAHLVGEGLVYRFLQKPVSPARVRAFIDAAIRRHSELIAEAPAAVVARKKHRRSRPRWIVLGLIALAIIGAIYGKWYRPEPSRSHTAAPKPAPLAVSSQQPSSTREMRSPAETPAATPNATRQTEAARDEAAIDRALAAQSARRPQTAATPASRTAPATTSDASAPVAIRSPAPPAQPAVPPAPTRSAAPGPAVDEAPASAAKLMPTTSALPDSDGQKGTDRLTALAQLAAQRIAEDRLIEPAGDNAREYLRQLNPEDALVAAPLWQQLAEHLLNKARREQQQGNFDSAELWLKEAEDTGVIGSEVAAVRADLRNARARASFLSNVVPVSQLKSTKYVPAAYPPKALDRGVEGWVELEFTVDASGQVRDIAVKRAVPTGVFEKAAADALGKWRFQPVVRNGGPVDQRASVRMQFKLER